MTVGELLTRMSSREVAEWGQYFEIVAWERENQKSASGMYNPDAPDIQELMKEK
jgi:hypothetical protein